MPHLETYQNDPKYLTLLAEAFMEGSELESAFEVLNRAVEIDPTGELGTEKFFYLGQIIGGQEGVRLLKVGIERLHSRLELVGTEAAKADPLITEIMVSQKTVEAAVAYMVEKINHALLACVEIWMTDLCMETEAESECETLIQYALTFQPTNPENWSTLGSIRISQQRNDEAKVALTKAWELFEARKTLLEDNEGDHVEYTELVQPLLALAHHLLNVFELELASSAASAVQDIDDSNLESYYLEAFACYLQVKRLKFERMAEAEKAAVENDFQNVTLNYEADRADEEGLALLTQARTALVAGWKLGQNADPEDQNAAEVGQQIEALLVEVGGRVKPSETRDEKFEVEEGWEKEIIMD